MAPRKRGKRRNNQSPSGTMNSELENDPVFFADYSIDTDGLKESLGVLSMKSIVAKNLPEDDFSAMLEAQLDVRDSLIDILLAKLEELLDEGRHLEKMYRLLKEKIQEFDKRGPTRNDAEKSEIRISPNNFEEKGSSPSLCNSSIPLEQEKVLARTASSEETSEPNHKAGDDKMKDKLKAMVALAFEAQGLDFGEIPGNEKSPTSPNHQDENDSEKEAGWQSEDGKSIADQVKEVAASVAEQSSHVYHDEVAAASVAEQSGYVYQEELGLYYDHKNGYYYNAKDGLYYYPKSGTYFYYDYDTGSYKFHSQVPTDSSSGNEQTNVEGAQYSLAESVHSSGSSESQAISISPSLRLMVVESGTDEVSVGELHVVTISGGKVGRRSGHAVPLLDEDVSEDHAEFSHRSDGPGDDHYFVKDIGSSSGTFVNGTCICIPGEPSDEVEIGHGWEVQFGTVKLKCHIHPGYLSCNECEPGLVNQHSQNKASKISIPREKARKKELRAIKKKYAIDTYSDAVPQLPLEYKDRAKKRRIEKGSDNPYEKTEVASTETELKDTNKGFKMLKKMGWSKGESLGQSQPGIINPIAPTSTVGREGLGFSMGLLPPTPKQVKRKKILDVTAKRFGKF